MSRKSLISIFRRNFHVNRSWLPILDSNGLSVRNTEMITPNDKILYMNIKDKLKSCNCDTQTSKKLKIYATRFRKLINITSKHSYYFTLQFNKSVYLNCSPDTKLLSETRNLLSVINLYSRMNKKESIPKIIGFVPDYYNIAMQSTIKDRNYALFCQELLTLLAIHKNEVGQNIDTERIILDDTILEKNTVTFQNGVACRI